MRDNLWNRCNVWRIPVHYNTNTETNTIWNLDSSNNEKGNCFISDSLTLFFHFKLFFYSKAETIFNKKAVKECLLHKLNLPVAMMAFQLWFNCIISCILSHDLSNDRYVLEEDAKRSTILQERIASISFSKNLITAFQTESRITHTVLYTSRHSVLLCLIFLKPAIIRQLTMCAFSGLWLLAIFFSGTGVCVCVCKCEFANVLWLCFSFWKFFWCACLFIYLCCVQAFSAVKATVDVLCAAQTAIHHQWNSLTAEPLTSHSQHPPFAATGTLLKSHRGQTDFIRLCVYLNRDLCIKD